MDAAVEEEEEPLAAVDQIATGINNNNSRHRWAIDGSDATTEIRAPISLPTTERAAATSPTNTGPIAAAAAGTAAAGSGLEAAAVKVVVGEEVRGMTGLLPQERMRGVEEGVAVEEEEE